MINENIKNLENDAFVAINLADAAHKISNDMIYVKNEGRGNYWTYKEDTAYTEFFFECHRDNNISNDKNSIFNFMLPDDERYEMIHKALDIMMNYDDEGDYTEGIDENVPIYTSNLLAWLSSRNDRYAYVEDAVKEYGIDSNDFDLIGCIGMGYYTELEEVLYLAKDWIESNFTFSNEDAE